jgi:hypothetical protein
LGRKCVDYTNSDSLPKTTFGPREGKYLIQDSITCIEEKERYDYAYCSRWMIHKRQHNKIIDWVSGKEYNLCINPKEPLFKEYKLNPTELYKFDTRHSCKDSQIGLVYCLENAKKLICILDSQHNILYEETTSTSTHDCVFKFVDGIITEYACSQYTRDCYIVRTYNLKTRNVTTGHYNGDLEKMGYTDKGLEISLRSMFPHADRLLDGHQGPVHIQSSFTTQYFGGVCFQWHYKKGEFRHEKNNGRTAKYFSHLVALGKNPTFTYGYSEVGQEEGLVFRTEKGYYTLLEL